MKKISYTFSKQATDYYFEADFSGIEKFAGKDQAVLVTDENVFASHKKKFKGWKTIVLKPGEQYKTQATVNSIIEQLIEYKADRKTFIVGVGGGVVTDLTGFAASVYMRGLPFGFVPTSILAMVDASIGGKNGIDIGVYKNLVGIIRQPHFLLYDTSFLRSLPKHEWVNGFAEIIKHSCIRDIRLFRQLEKNGIAFYRKEHKALNDLIRKNVVIKSDIVKKDEFEQGDRRLLNFGHTMGHAIENMYGLLHGHAVSIGMVVAARLSEKLTGFRDTEKLINVLLKYGLPAGLEYDKEKAFSILEMDKKKAKNNMNYVLLKKIGEGVVKPIPLDELKTMLLNN